MINLLVVAGSTSDRLSDFLVNRGTFDVQFCYSSLYENVSEIQNQIIKTDKMLYLYQVDESTGSSVINIKSDMQVLRSLIKAGGFFDPGEIVFVTGKSELAERAVQFFKTVMQECGKEDYSIEILEGRLTFSSIYETLMGISVTKDFKNTYRNVYRVERNSDADKAYVGSDDRELLIEPFRYDSLGNYEMRRESIIRTDSGYVNTDRSSERKQFDSPDFGQMKFTDMLGKQKVVLVSGGEKSGKTMWSAVLGKSAVEAGKTVCILDFTRCGGIDQVYSGINMAVNDVRMLELAGNLKIIPGQLYLCRIRNQGEDSVKMEFLQNMFARKSKPFDCVFVVVDMDALTECRRLLRNVLSGVVMLVSAVMQDIVRLQGQIVEAGLEDVAMTVILNENLRLFKGAGFVSAEDAKAIFGDGVKVVRPVFFDSLDVGSSIYKAIVG